MELKVIVDPESQQRSLIISVLDHGEALGQDVREIRDCLAAQSDTISLQASVLAGKVEALQRTLAKWAMASLFINTTMHLILKFLG